MKKLGVFSSYKFKTTVLSLLFFIYLCPLDGAFSESFVYSQAPVIKIYCREDMCSFKKMASKEYEKRSGYIYEYLYEIAQTNNWLYEFSTDDRGGMEVVDILKEGYADIAACMDTVNEKGSGLVYSKSAFTEVYAALYIPIESKYHCKTIWDLAGKKIGLVEGYSKNKEFIKAMILQNSTTEFVYFKNKGQIYDAMRTKVIAGAFLVGNKIEQWCTPLVSFGHERLYFAATPEKKDLIAKLDSAAEETALLNPDFMSKIVEKYCPQISNEILDLTEKEINYITKNKIIVAGLSVKGYPSEFKDEVYLANGIGPDILTLLNEYTGLRFLSINNYSYNEAISNINKGTIHILPYFKQSYSMGLENGFNISRPYLKIPTVIITKKDFNKPILRMAVPSALLMSQQIKMDFNNTAVFYFKSAEECLRMLKKGEVDAAVTNSGVAESLLNYSEFSDLAAEIYPKLYEEVSIAVSTKADPMLLSIINKGLSRIPEDKLNSIVMKHSIKTRNQNISNLIELYPLETGILVTSIVAFIMSLLGFIAWSRSKEKRHLEKLHYSDSLTGYKNFNYFLENAHKILEKYSEQRYAVVRLNLVEFKFINDTLGYDVGNDVLIGISDMLSDFIDPETELFARMYADKFALLLAFKSNSDLGARVEQLYCQFEKFNNEGVTRYPLIFNGGIYVIKDIKMSIKTAFDYATFAEKSLLKYRHANACAYYNGKVFEDIYSEKAIESSMREALQSGFLTPYLQPKVNCKTQEVVGAEALARWIDPVKGVITPDKFIPYFEKSGFITELDLYMFEQSCKIIKKWVDEGKKPIPISCNFSYRDICDRTLERIKELLTQYDISPHLLEIEITETMAVENLEMLSAYGERINEFGLKLCIDDFGTGYSSISLLQKISIDALKIDKELITRGSEKEFSADLLRGLITTLKNHSVQIICEGVETEAQREFVEQLGCEIIQGYLYSVPLPVIDFENKYL